MIDKKELYCVNIIGYKKQYNGFEYYVLKKSNGEIIFDSYKFLNIRLSKSSDKQRERCFIALKLLFSYMELFCLNSIYDFEINNVNKLLGFLKGGYRNGNNIIFKGKTQRSNSTINNYIGVYRVYFDYLGIENSLFSKRKIIGIQKGGIGFFAHTQKQKIEKYKISRKVYESNEVPSYISFEEYKEIIKLVREKYSLREEIIIKLMYEYGLRIGEVLGLTTEDIVNDERSKFSQYQIQLRNRYSDKPFQRCKGCMNVYSRDVYQEHEYQMKGFNHCGYQVVDITSDTYELLQEYIEENLYSPFISNKLKNNLKVKAKADKIKKNSYDNNYYIFISKNYGPITGNAWNTILKSIFTEANIALDSQVKKNGLNHRFRHGFAMFKVLVEGYDLLRLQRVLRHSSPDSCRAYFKATKSDYIRFFEVKKRLLDNGGYFTNETIN